MSWSDHKDDKSRFDGWREFLNEGKEQQPEQVIKEEAQTISEEGDRPPRPSNQQRLVNNLLKGSPDFGKEWSSADLIAVAEAWKVINALSQDVQTAAAMDDAWSAIRQGVPGGGIQGWDKSVYVANALATGKMVDQDGVPIALPEKPTAAALSEGDEPPYEPFSAEPGEITEIDTEAPGPTRIYEKRADGVLRHLTDVQNGNKAQITIGPVKDLAESEQILSQIIKEEIQNLLTEGPEFGDEEFNKDSFVAISYAEGWTVLEIDNEHPWSPILGPYDKLKFLAKIEEVASGT